MTSGPAPRTVPRVIAIGHGLFLVGVLLMVTGDGPSSTIRIAKWPTPMPWLAWEWLYLALLASSIVCLAAGGGLRPWARPSMRFLTPAAAAVLVVALFSTVFSQVRMLSAEALVALAGILAFSWVVALIVDDDRLVSALWPTLALAMLFLAFRVIVWRRDEGLGVMAFQVFNNAWVGKLQLAWVFNLVGPLLLARLLGERRWPLGILFALAWIGAGLATYLLYSRMGTVVFAASTAGVLALNREYWRSWLLVMAAVVVVAVVVLGTRPFARTLEMSRAVVSTVLTPDENPGVGMRLGVWRDSLRLFRTHPITGTGLGTFDVVAYGLPGTTAEPVFFRHGWHAHNVYLHVLAETGLPGLMAWCYLWYAIVRQLAGVWRRADGRGRLDAAGALCAVVAFLLLSMTEVLIGARVHASLRMNLTLGLVVGLGLTVLARPSEAARATPADLGGTR